MLARRGQFIFSAIILGGCLVVGVVLAVFVHDAPAVLIAVVMAFAAAMLVYAFLGGISEAGFNFGPVKVTGSAAMLLGSAWWINMALEPQLERIRDERRIEQFSFDFDQHAAPADGWFAIDERTAVPVEVEFTDPVTEQTAEVVTPPSTPNLPLKLVPEPDNDNYLVMGAGAETGSGLGYVSALDLISAVSAFGLQPGTGYGFQRLHLATEGELPYGMVRRWGNTTCRGASMPFEIEALRFNRFADYDLRRCDAPEGAPPDHSSSLASGDGELVTLTIEGNRRSFLIAVVAADHRVNPYEPPWSTFFVTEMISGR